MFQLFHDMCWRTFLLQGHLLRQAFGSMVFLAFLAECSGTHLPSSCLGLPCHVSSNAAKPRQSSQKNPKTEHAPESIMLSLRAGDTREKKNEHPLSDRYLRGQLVGP